MALVFAGDEVVAPKKSASPAKAVAKPASPAKAPAAPKMVPTKSNVGPSGGKIDFARGADPNGYYWVDDGTDSGYWYRPDDGKVWRSGGSPMEQAAVLRSGSTFGPSVPLTNAPTPKKSIAKETIQDVIARSAAQAAQDAAPSNSGLGGLVKSAAGAVGGVVGAAAANPVVKDVAGRARDAIDYGFNQAIPGFEAYGIAGAGLNYLRGAELNPPGVTSTESLAPQSLTNRLPDWAENSVRFSTSPLGATLNLLPVAGVSNTPARIALNAAQDLGFGAIQAGAEKLGVPEPAAYGLALAGSFGAEAGLGRSISAGESLVRASAKRSAANAAEEAAQPSVARQVDDILNPKPAAAPPRVVGPDSTGFTGEITQGGTVRPLPPRAVPAPVAPEVVVPPVPTRTVPSGAGRANPKPPPAGVTVEGDIVRKKGSSVLEERVLVDGQDMGVIKRDAPGEPFSAWYRNQNGALTPVPVDAAGTPFTTKVRAGAKNSVYWASTSKGHLLEDKPIAPRTPKAAAAAEVVPSASGIASNDPDLTVMDWPTYAERERLAAIAKMEADDPRLIAPGGGMYNTYTRLKAGPATEVINRNRYENNLKNDPFSLTPMGIREGYLTPFQQAKRGIQVNTSPGAAPSVPKYDRPPMDAAEAGVRAYDEARLGGATHEDAINAMRAAIDEFTPFGAVRGRALDDAKGRLFTRANEGLPRSPQYDEAIAFEARNGTGSAETAIAKARDALDRATAQFAAMERMDGISAGAIKRAKAELAARSTAYEEAVARAAVLTERTAKLKEIVEAPSPNQTAPKPIPGLRGTAPVLAVAPVSPPLTPARQLDEALTPPPPKVAKTPIKPGMAVEYNGKTYVVRTEPTIPGGTQRQRHISTVGLEHPGTREMVVDYTGHEVRAAIDKLTPTLRPIENMTPRQMIAELGDKIPKSMRAQLYKLPDEVLETQQRPILESMVAEKRAENAARAAAEQLDTPEVRAAADAVAAESPKDFAVPGSASHARAQAVAEGNAGPADIALHEAEVRGAQAEVVASSSVPPPSPDPVTFGIVGEITAAQKAKRPPRLAGKVARGTGQAALYPIRGLRDLKLAGDLALGRQMWGALLADTTRAVPAVGRGLRAAIPSAGFIDPFKTRAFRNRFWAESEAFAEANPWATSIMRRGQRNKLGEELFMTSLFGRLPGLARIEEVNGIILNAFRMSWMQHNLKLAADAGQDITDPTFLRSLDEVAGVLSGRGYGTFLDNNARWLNTTLTISARYTGSKPQFWATLLPSSFGGTPVGRTLGLGIEHPWVAARARRRVIKAAAVGAAGFAMLSLLPGVEAVTDPFSSRFGQFRWKGKWYDYTGGLTDPIRLGLQIGYNRQVSERGFPRALSENPKIPNRVFESVVRGIGGYIQNRIPPASRVVLETMGWIDPFQDEPMPGVPGWAQKYIPISIAQYRSYWEEVHSVPDALYAAVPTALTAAGFNVRAQSPVTTWEEGIVRDHGAELDLPEYKLRDGEPVSADNISRTGWQYIENHPEIFGKKPDTAFGEGKEQKDRVAAQRAEHLKVQERDDALATGINAKMDRREWRTLHGANRRNLSAALEAEYGDSFQNDPDSPDVVKRYYAAIESFSASGEPDWDAVEEWTLALSPADRAELDAYIGLRHELGTPLEQQYYHDMDLISESGYYEVRQAAFEEWKHSDEFASQFETYDEWKEAWVRAETERKLAAVPDMSPTVARRDANAAFLNATDFNDAFKATHLYDWVEKNPLPAQLVEEWQIRDKWDKAARAIIYDQDPSEANTTESAYRATSKVKSTVITTPAGQGPYEDWEERAWRDYATEERLRTPDGKPGSDFASATDYRAAGGEDDWSNDSVDTAAITFTYTEGGKKKTGRLSPGGAAQVQSMLSLWKADPDAVREAFRLNLPGFKVGTDLSKTEVAWLRSQGVDVPE